MSGGTDAEERRVRASHGLAALAALALYATSPWVAMLRRIPQNAGLADRAHVLLGSLAFACAVVLLVAAATGGRGRNWFCWAAGRGGALGRDLAGLLRGRLPPTDGPGLVAAVQGLALLLLLAAGATGLGWLAQGGGPAAPAWRAAHLLAVHALAGALVAHALAGVLNLVEFLRG